MNYLVKLFGERQKEWLNYNLIYILNAFEDKKENIKTSQRNSQRF